MRSGQARLQADALVRLQRLNEVTSLAADEQRALADLLAKPTVPAGTRIGFVRLAADRGWKDAVPALRAASVESPEVLDAVLAARARLGAPADKAELRRYLDSKDPKLRAAAIRALAALPDAGVSDLGRYATGDKAVDVRVAAIEALGSTKQPAAIPTLSQTFGEPIREVRQASGRALLSIGGNAANDAFVNIALHGGDADTRKYAAVLLLVSQGKDSPAVQRLMASNPGGDVRDVIEHGLQWQHSHHQQVAE
jgi:HEAT repeat protein